MLPKNLAIYCLFIATAMSFTARAVPPLEALGQAAPYGPDHTWPALTAAQWTGEAGVDAVVILSIDDMRDSAKYEAHLRPILDRLAAIGAPGALSIFVNSLEPGDPQLQAWLAEGVSLEVHTIRHPCPMLCQGNLAEAKKTFDECVDLLGAVPNMKPVAARVPCCDSMNSASPRYFSEIFSKTTPNGAFLQIDSSVFCVFNPDDPSWPEELLAEDGQPRGRFEKYLPFPAFTTTIANYPYPYVIGDTTWEFPCVVPSDWEAQNKNTPNAPQTVADMKAAIDATVLKQGTYTLCFHPHGWIEAAQIVELIDHAHAQYGERVRFMSFREAAQRLREQLLQGEALRAADGAATGARLADVNADGYMDVLLPGAGKTRVWMPEERSWKEEKTPFALGGERQVVLLKAGDTAAIAHDARRAEAWRHDGSWKKSRKLGGIPTELLKGMRAVDLDGDGMDELIGTADTGATIARWDATAERWETLGYTLPGGTGLLDAERRDAGLRFIDVDEDRDLDVIFSNGERFGLWLFEDMATGWATEAFSGSRGAGEATDEIPAIAVNGTDNGFWTAKRTAWWHNELTDTLPDKVDRRTFAQLLAKVKPKAKTVAQASASMRSPGREVVAVAAEPLVRDPVCIAWDARGRLWTAEMRDYPLGLNNDGTPGSEIRVLDDLDGDGIYDKATVFLDGLAFANGVLPWRDGVLVTCAPQIFYAEDRDGDGKADYREVLFEGFVEGNQQHRINGLRWGGDGWIYAANGDSNGRITSTKTGAVVDIRGRDIRFNPDTGALETVTGNAQFGRARDDFGRWFGCANWSPMWYFTLDEHYQERNPFLAVPDPRDYFIESNRVYPASVITERFNDFHMAGIITSACGVEVYRDNKLGPGFESGVHVFTNEPVHNLVMRARGEFTEGGFTGGRVAEERSSEFLASTDTWFRPVMTRTGPDGALYVADMYRAVIEHPEYINVEKQKEIDMRAGEDEGRIWRVAPVGWQRPAVPDLTTLDTAALAALFRTENGALRDLAQQRLFELAPQEAVAPLRALAMDESASAASRTAALWSLRLLDGLDGACVLAGLGSDSDGLVINALQLAEPMLAGDTAVQAAVKALIDTAGARPAIRVQLAYTLGEWDSPEANAGLSALLAGGETLRIAAISSMNERNISALWQRLLETAGNLPRDQDDASEQILSVLTALLLKAGDTGTVTAFVTSCAPEYDEPATRPWLAMCALLDNLERFGVGVPVGARDRMEKAILDARAMVADENARPATRAVAARLLGREDALRKDDARALTKAISPLSPPELNKTALRQLQRIGTPDVAALLIENWGNYSPALQAEAAEVLFSRGEWSEQLVAALEKGTILPRQLGAPQRQRLLTDDRPGMRARVVKALGETASPDRQRVIDEYRGATSLAGDTAHGKAIFTERCAACHLLDGVGNRVGADLASMTDRRPEAIIVSVLDPNRSVETRYLSYDVETKDLSTFSGILTEESATGLTLTGANGQSQQVLRSDITAIRATNRSIMPEGLEEGLAPQDLADLLAFVAGSESAPKAMAGNAPETVTPDAAGNLVCTAAHAEVRGTTLVYEERTQNLGYWGSADDHAVWRLAKVPAGKYRVTMEYCCDNTTSGNPYRLMAGANVLSGQVHGTGTWDNYRTTTLGTVVLTGAETSLTFAPDGAPRGYLIDLRNITLTPVK